MAWRAQLPPPGPSTWNSPANVINFPNKLKNNRDPLTFNNYRRGVNYVEVNEGNHKFYYNKNMFKEWYERKGTNPATQQPVTKFRIVKFKNNNSSGNNGNAAARQAAAKRKKNNMIRAMAAHWQIKTAKARSNRRNATEYAKLVASERERINKIRENLRRIENEGFMKRLWHAEGGQPGKTRTGRFKNWLREIVIGPNNMRNYEWKRLTNKIKQRHGQ